MKLSVVIPTRNRADVLGDCLESLARQEADRTSFEVIVVDNGSTDHTAQVATRHSRALPLVYVQAPEPGLHVGRHAGASRAGSDLLTFCDDDIIADPTWIGTILSVFRDEDVAMVGGNNLPIFEGEVPGWLGQWWGRKRSGRRALAALSILDFGQGQFDVDPGFVWGCNFSIRRKVLEAAGGFHPDGMPEDLIRFRGDGESHVSDYVRSAGLRCVFHSGASVGHRVPAERMTERYFLKRAYAQGISDSFGDFRSGQAGPLDGRLPMRRRLRQALSWLAIQSDAIRLGRAPGLGRLRTRMLGSYRNGYTFHQTQLADDPDLRAWVLKERYDQ